jgi:medium-chain acyl-[acyl-carrier-protein] hydrolase
VSEPRWLVRWPRAAPAAVRLVCFGHAGAGASAYRAWAQGVPEAVQASVEVCAVRLPGRESRRREPPFEDMRTLVAAMAPALLESLDPPYALFGHCSGALVAFELARALARLGHPPPVVLAVAAQPPPRLQRSSDEERAADVRDRLRWLGATDEAILDNEAFFSVLRPAVMADFRILDGYAYVPGPPLAAPIAVFAPAGERAGADGWAGETAAGATVLPVAGGHFFEGEAWHGLGLAVAAEVERRALARAAGG